MSPEKNSEFFMPSIMQSLSQSLMRSAGQSPMHTLAQVASPISALEPVTLSRRSILKTGMLGTMMLVGASTLAQLQGCASVPATSASTSTNNKSWKLLRPKDRAILGAVAPIALGNAFPQDRQAALDTFLPQVDNFLFSTSTANHAALHQLFDLLDLGVTRVLLTGVWGSWENLSDEQVDDFLNGWRNSSMNQLRLGYAQLTQVLSLVWYAQPTNIPTSIYPGPPAHIPMPLAHERPTTQERAA